MEEELFVGGGPAVVLLPLGNGDELCDGVGAAFGLGGVVGKVGAVNAVAPVSMLSLQLEMEEELFVGGGPAIVLLPVGNGDELCDGVGAAFELGGVVGKVGAVHAVAPVPMLSLRLGLEEELFGGGGPAVVLLPLSNGDEFRNGIGAAFGFEGVVGKVGAVLAVAPDSGPEFSLRLAAALLHTGSIAPCNGADA